MGDLEAENKPVLMVEKHSNGLSNGLSNGTPDHKDERHKNKDSHRDKDRHKSSHKSKDRDKDKDRSRDDRDKSSKDKDRHSSSHKSSHKDKDRHRDKERSAKDKSDRDRKDKERSDKDRSDKERSDKDRSDKERSDKDKSREKSRDEREKDKSKDKDRERSDKDKHRDKERDKDRDKDKKKSTSSSSGDKKDKDRHHTSSHKSSHKDKSRDKDRDKENRGKDRSKEKYKANEEIKVEKPSLKIEEEEEFTSNVNSMDGSVSLASFMNIKNEPTVDSEEDSRLIIKDEKIEDDWEEEDSKLVIKEERSEEDEDDMPLAARKRVKVEDEEDDDDDKPLIARKKVKSEKKRKNYDEDDGDDDDFKPQKKKVKKEKPMPKSKKAKGAKNSKSNRSQESVTTSPVKGKKKKEEEENVWRWWEEKKRDDGVKWTFLEHQGPVFADPYVRVPSHIKFSYNGKHVQLSQDAEEYATFYAKMLDHDYTKKDVFNKNFFKDWRKLMTSKERELITDLKLCNFTKLHAYFNELNEERKNRSKEEKKALKEKNEALIVEYGWCLIDGHKQRIANFKIEPPGLFRGRGEHPKQGMAKKRTMPEDVIINCSQDSKIPKPPEGHRWKKVQHDNQVTWLACWNENITGSTKYVMLNAASKLKGEKDWQKYEMARKLHKRIDKIRDNYIVDWRSKEMRIRQRGVALYFIDKLALRAGNEKDEDQADTVGCCSLRYEHVKLHERKNGKDFVVEFDFLGKDSIRYYNEVAVEKKVFKNLQLFRDGKQPGDDLFDRLNTQILNKYLSELMEGLTAKVFRTYNASRTLQEQLEKMSVDGEPLAAQILAYNRANREVAILCNHQRAVPKTFDKSMSNLQQKINDKKELVEQTARELKDLKKAAKHSGSVAAKANYDKKKKALDRLQEQLDKLEISATDKEENKQISLGTSKLNYLDPRISVAWCKKNNIAIEKVYNKTQRQKFQWAIDMATAEYNFLDDSNSCSFSQNVTNNDDEDDEEEDDE